MFNFSFTGNLIAGSLMRWQGLLGICANDVSVVQVLSSCSFISFFILPSCFAFVDFLSVLLVCHEKNVDNLFDVAVKIFK